MDAKEGIDFAAGISHLNLGCELGMWRWGYEPRDVELVCRDGDLKLRT